MELSALLAFTEVARTGSFSEAAAALFLTQPAVSKRIAVLEAELGTRLFDRIGRHVAPTEAGITLLPRARRLLNDAADMKRLISDLEGNIGGTLVMATSHHIGLHRLPPVLRRFVHDYPDVKLDIRFMDSEAACKSVLAGELQLAIVTLPPTDELEKIAITNVWSDPLEFAASPNHPLAKLRSPKLANLAAWPAVLPSRSTYTRRILEQAMADHDLTLNVSMSTNYLETLKMLAGIGLGWSLIPASMLDATIVALDVRALRLQRALGIVVHRDRSLSNAERAMIEACKLDALNSGSNDQTKID